jgi:hypothetical protein
MTDVTLLLPLIDAGLMRDSGAAADLIAGDCELVMMPTWESQEESRLF